MLIIVLPLYVYQRTGSALATGIMFLVEVLPPLLFGSLAGVFVDRWSYKWTMVMSDLARALVLLPLLLIQQPELLWLIYPITFIGQVLSLFFSPAAGALLPQLVKDEQLTAANSLSRLAIELTRLLGPTLGGGLFVVLGIQMVILLDAASFLFSALMTLLIAQPHREKLLVKQAEQATSWPIVKV